jgi:aminopeptidase
MTASPSSRTFPTLQGERTFPAFDLVRLLRTVFDPVEGCRVAMLIDLQDPSSLEDFAFLRDPRNAVQIKAHEVFYRGLHGGAMRELGLSGGELFAYARTGGSNLDLPARGVAADGRPVDLAEALYAPYDLILCISEYSATAPLTALAKQHQFRGATLHGLNDIIVHSGLAVDYLGVSRDAEKLRLGVTRAEWVEIEFVLNGDLHRLRLRLDGQEAQKSHGLCHGRAPDVANLPAGEVYFVPVSAEGCFPMKYEHDGSIGLQRVRNGRIEEVEFVSGNPATIEAHRARLASDPVTGVIGELGLGTQVLPFSGADIQDEKTLGTVHVATGRSDHLGGHLVPGMFAEAKNATHDDILFHPEKTPEIGIARVRMRREGTEQILIENYQPSAYFAGLLG